MAYYTPKQIVDELDKYIVGQSEAKKAVAIALRNRYRRSQLPIDVQEEITPKNIIMEGPTGVGKTEIARRLAKLVKAPFIKVEATKFTEVGYVGRDVESMVRDLVEAAIRLVKAERLEGVKERSQAAARARLLDLLAPLRREASKPNNGNPLASIFGPPPQQVTPQPVSPEEQQQLTVRRTQVEEQLDDGMLDNLIVEIEVKDTPALAIDVAGMGAADIDLGSIFGNMLPQRTKKRKVSVSEARTIFEQEEADKLIDMDDVTSEAVRKAEQDGIIFIDEIDKVAGKTMGSGPDISREGVQRDILPIVEGSTVMTKYGPVKTDYMLFIAAGAFHTAKVSDLIPELQGRFPIKVKLNNLTKEDLKCILTQPENAITKQYAALLSVDNVCVTFSDDALEEIAAYASLVNETSENIGARRLHTIIETLLEDISFNAGGNHPIVNVDIDAQYVKDHLKKEYKEKDLQKYIL